MFVDSLKKFGVEERFIRKLKTAGVDTMERLDRWMKENNRDHFEITMTTGSEKGAFEVLKGYSEFKKNSIPWG